MDFEAALKEWQQKKGVSDEALEAVLNKPIKKEVKQCTRPPQN